MYESCWLSEIMSPINLEGWVSNRDTGPNVWGVHSHATEKTTAETEHGLRTLSALDSRPPQKRIDTHTTAGAHAAHTTGTLLLLLDIDGLLLVSAAVAAVSLLGVLLLPVLVAVHGRRGCAVAALLLVPAILLLLLLLGPATAAHELGEHAALLGGRGDGGGRGRRSLLARVVGRLFAWWGARGGGELLLLGLVVGRAVAWSIRHFGTRVAKTAAGGLLTGSTGLRGRLGPWC